MDNKSTPNQGHSDDMKRYLGALNEQHAENLKAIREGFGVMEKRFDRVEERLDSHTEMIGKLMMDVQIIKDDIVFIKGDLKKKVDADEFQALERRVLLLEKRR